MLTTQQKIKKLQNSLSRIEDLRGKNANDVEFVVWQSATLDALRKVFSNKSYEYSNFKKLYFSVLSAQGSTEVQEAYERDLTITERALRQYIEDLQDEYLIENPETQPSAPLQPQTPAVMSNVKKVFISHASADKEIVGELVELLKLMGLQHDQIFCTSFPEYGIPLGVNYLDWIKAEITDNALVLLVLSKKFYLSPVCLAEMGATWVLSKNHVPLVVPPLTYDEVKGVVPLTQGMHINERLKYNELAKLVDRQFGLTAGRAGDWERSRDKIVNRIDAHIDATAKAEEARAQAAAYEEGRPWRELKAIMDNTKKELGWPES